MKKHHKVIGECSAFVIPNYISYVQTEITVIDLISQFQT